LGADPQIPVFHPLVFAVGLLGPVWTLKWEMLAQLTLGLWALNNWLKRWHVDETGRLWGLLLFAGGGFTVAHFMVGHVTLGFYPLLPLYFLLSHRLCDRRELDRRLPSAFFLVFFLYCTLYKPNFLIYAAPPLFIEALCRSWLMKSFRPLLLLIAGTAAGALVSAVSLLPASQYFAEFPRVYDATTKHTPVYSLIANVLLPLKAIPAAWYGTDFMQRHEYSVFLGPLAVFFAFCAMRRRNPRQNEAYALVAYILSSAWLGFGADSQENFPSLYALLQPIWPGFSSIRVPVRFWYGVFLGIAVFSAVGLKWPTHRGKQAVVWIFGVLPLLANAGINLGKITWFSSQPQWQPARAASQFSQEHSQPDFPYSQVRKGAGVIECVENLQANRAPQLKPGGLLDFQSEKPLSFQGSWLSWNHIRIVVESAENNRVVLNLNHHPYWKLQGDKMKLVSTSSQPLTLETSAGLSQADLVFHQPYLAMGLEISLFAVSFLVVWVFFFFRRSRPPWRIGLTGGIATGKTLVAQHLRKRGWIVVDLDSEARRLTDSDPATQEKIRSLFGSDLFQNGVLNRKLLRERFFEDGEKRLQLENFLHPLLIAAFETRYRQATRAGVRAVVCEAALLVETSYYTNFDRLIVVTAPFEVRRERLKKRDSVTDAEVHAILKAQASDDAKIRHADFVIQNDGDKAALEKAVENTIPPI
jgi:dephospho-CoA kinase